MKRMRVAVLGLGQFGSALARELTELGAEVLAIDAASKRIDEIKDSVSASAVADIRDKSALEELFTSGFDLAVIAIGGALEASILATLYLRDLPVKEVWAEAETPERATVLERVGAHRVLSPEADLGKRLAQRIVNPNLVDYLALAGDSSVVKVQAPEWCHGKTLAALNLRPTMRIAVIAVQRGDGDAVVVPGAETEIRAGDVLTIVGMDDDLAKFQDRK